MRNGVHRGVDDSVWMEPLVLVEPNLDLDNGHWGDSVMMLAAAAAAKRGRKVVVVGARPPSETVHRSMAKLGVSVADAARVGLLSKGLGRIGSWLGVREARRRERGDYGGASDIWLLRVLIDEVVSLWVARRVAPADARVVLLTGSSSYIGLSVALSRCRHIRVVHDVQKPVGRFAAKVALLGFGVAKRVSLVCPTAGVADALSGLWRGSIHVRPFALRDRRLYINPKERAAGRRRRGIEAGDFVVAVVGGWWPAKDVATILSALTLVGPGVRAIVAGYPIDSSRLRSVALHLQGRLVVVEQPLSRDDLRGIYAVADACVVSRHPGIVKESGLFFDGLRYGVHIVVSDHDPSVSAQIEGFDYVSLFRACDSADLANTIDRLHRCGVARPGPTAAEEFGLLSADEALDEYSSSVHSAASRPHRRARLLGARQSVVNVVLK